MALPDTGRAGRQGSGGGGAATVAMTTSDVRRARGWAAHTSTAIP